MLTKHSIINYINKTSDINLNNCSSDEILKFNSFLDLLVDVNRREGKNLPSTFTLKDLIFYPYFHKNLNTNFPCLFIESKTHVHALNAAYEDIRYEKSSNGNKFDCYCYRYDDFYNVEVLFNSNFKKIECIEDLITVCSATPNALPDKHGYIKSSYYQDDYKYREVFLLNYKKHGKETLFKNNHIISEETYFSDKREGKHIFYYEIEPYSIKRISHWRSDVQHGERISYDKKGNITSYANYYAGLLHGKRIKQKITTWFILGKECTEEEFNKFNKFNLSKIVIE